MTIRLDDLSDSNQPRRAVALGVFDGVHLGHQALLNEAVRIGREINALPAALTFDPHPASVFAPGRVPPLLGTIEERCELLHACGAEQVIVARFDREFAARAADEFVLSILLKRLNAGAVIVGEDFRYGRDRTGDAFALRRAGEQHGFLMYVVPPVFIHGIPARSTAIRQMIGGGQVEEAARLLGRSYTLWGEVVRGRQLGRTIGYPTVNLSSAPDVLVPATGVYAGRVHIGSDIHRAAISVGNNPTVAPTGTTLPRTVEAYLLDGFDRDIYGARIGIEFVALLRGMVKFGGLDEMTARIARDVDETRRILPIPPCPVFLSPGPLP